MAIQYEARHRVSIEGPSLVSNGVCSEIIDAAYKTLSDIILEELAVAAQNIQDRIGYPFTVAVA